MVTCLKEWFRLECDDVTNNGVFVTDEITTFSSSVVLNFFFGSYCKKKIN